MIPGLTPTELLDKINEMMVGDPSLRLASEWAKEWGLSRWHTAQRLAFAVENGLMECEKRNGIKRYRQK